MAMPRRDGATSFMRLSFSMNSPSVIGSRPAMRRKSVDLPQPEGPTNTISSRSFTSRSMPWRTSTALKRFLMPRSDNRAKSRTPFVVSQSWWAAVCCVSACSMLAMVWAALTWWMLCHPKRRAVCMFSSVSSTNMICPGETCSRS